MLAPSGVYDLGVGPLGHRSAAPPHLVFLYLGRRGLSRFTLELARTIAELKHVRATFCVSRQNEIFEAFGGLRELGCRVLPVDTFAAASGALLRGYRVRALCRSVLDELAGQRSTGAVTLMPHVWTPLLAPLIRKRGFRYVTVVHDGRPHPGDLTGLLNGWSMRDAQSANAVVTLSRSVADALAESRALPRERLVPLFHPDLRHDVGLLGSDASASGVPAAAIYQPPATVAWPFRIMFFGRIMAYKGLPTLVEAVERLRAEGLPVGLGVFGEGPLGDLRERLAALGAEVENRWIADSEVGGVLSRYHAVALAHSECSQSGVAALALGAGLPVIASRVGGLAEQVTDGTTGVLADGSDAASLAAAIRRLAVDRRLYAAICAGIRRTAWERSMRRFAEHLVALATATVSLPRDERMWV